MRKQIENSLKEQLKLQGKTAGFYGNLVDDYMRYWDLKELLLADIQENGLRCKYMNGNGFEVVKPNESVANLQKTTATMLKILSDLNLKEPVVQSDADGDYA